VFIENKFRNSNITKTNQIITTIRGAAWPCLRQGQSIKLIQVNSVTADNLRETNSFLNYHDPRDVIRALIRAKPETKLCLRQIFDSWKQSFAFGKSLILGSKVLPKTNLCPDDIFIR
jgi:hypothetical protein